MQLQNFEQKNKKIKDAFLELKQNHPEKFSKRLKFSWSNWGFGLEDVYKRQPLPICHWGRYRPDRCGGA